MTGWRHFDVLEACNLFPTAILQAVFNTMNRIDHRDGLMLEKVATSMAQIMQLRSNGISVVREMLPRSGSIVRSA
jgi:hypothetical protein